MVGLANGGGWSVSMPSFSGAMVVGAVLGLGSFVEGTDMTDMIDFLEAVGTDARLRCASPEEIELELESVQGNEELREALRSGNVLQMRERLSSEVLFSVQFPGKEDDEEDEDDREEDPGHEGDEVGLQLKRQTLACAV